MKKLIIFVIVLCLTLSVFTLVGCNQQQGYDINVVCTVFSEYDWVRQISDGVDGVGITMLLDNGVDLHSYQPSVRDIALISSCDLFVYVGGESDSWVDGALANAVNPDRKVINLLEVLGDNAKEEQIVEGMEDEHEHDDGTEEVEYDEHVWLSLKNAQLFCEKIAQALCEIDQANADTYTSNLSAYKQSLQELDTEYRQAVSSATKDTLVFGDRFPFRYLVDDYGLNYYAAFVGCSAESEASFETIVFLANKIDQLGLKAVLTTEGNNNGIAQTVIKNTASKNQTVLVLDSMQSVTAQSLKDGANYLEIMQSNLAIITQALQ